MKIKLLDSELRVMDIIWEKEPISAKDLSIIAQNEFGWNKNTTYTVIKKIEGKGYLCRTDPGFICTSLISKKQVCKEETRGLIDKLYGGSRKALFSALFEDEELSAEEIEALRKMIDEKK